MILRNEATTWVEAMCPRPEVHVRFLEHLEQAIERGVGCSFVVGRALTRNGKSYLVHCFCGHVFAFELNQAQVARLHGDDNRLSCTQGQRKQDHGPQPEPLISLDPVEVDNAAALDRSKPAKVTLKYRAHQWIQEPLAVHVVFEPPNRNGITRLHYPWLLPLADGTRQFELAPLSAIADAAGTPFVGPLLLFFQVWTAEEYKPPAPTLPPGKSTRPVAHGVHPYTPPAPWKPTPTPSPSPVIPATFNPMVPNVPPSKELRSISDIRAVLVDVV